MINIIKNISFELNTPLVCVLSDSKKLTFEIIKSECGVINTDGFIGFIISNKNNILSENLEKLTFFGLNINNGRDFIELNIG